MGLFGRVKLLSGDDGAGNSCNNKEIQRICPQKSVSQDFSDVVNLVSLCVFKLNSYRQLPSDFFKSNAEHIGIRMKKSISFQ